MSELSRHHLRWLLTLCVGSALSGCGADDTTLTSPPATTPTTSAMRNHADGTASKEAIATILPASACRGAIHAAFVTKPRDNASAEPARIIVRLVGRHIITITTGPRGPRYSASTPAGDMISDGLTLDELRGAHPEIYREVSGTASASAGTLIADLGD